MNADTDHNEARRANADSMEVETDGNGIVNGVSAPAAQPSDQGNTLVIARTVSLTLWKDSLFVVGKIVDWHELSRVDNQG